MIAKGMILFRIQRFQQRRSRIAPEITGHLVHFIQQEQRIQAAYLLHPVNQPPRHGPDVCPAMSANLRLVPHAAQRNPGKLTVDGFRNRQRHGSLAHTGRAYQA